MNQEALEIFWEFVNERHLVYLNKTAGLPKPWTEDKILQDWKFCNIFRQLDKTTVWLQDNVIEPYWESPPELLLFNIFVFRSFNWVPTYEILGGWQTQWYKVQKQMLLAGHVEVGEKIMSGAYMIRGMEGKPKYISIPETLSRIWEEKTSLLDDIESEHSLQNAFESIMDRKYWGWGPFTAYQIVLDLLYSPILFGALDVNLWCSFGPGAKRGLKIIFPQMGGNNNTLLDHCIYLHHTQDKYRASHVPELNLQDIEYSACEFAKYWRIKTGGAGTEHYNGRS